MPEQREKVKELEKHLAEEIREDATCPNSGNWDRYDVMWRWSTLLDAEGLPLSGGSEFMERDGAGHSWLRRFLARHGLKIAKPKKQRAKSLKETREDLENVWSSHRRQVERAEEECRASRQAGRPARVVLLNCDETSVRYKYAGLGVCIPTGDTIDPQQYAAEPDTKKCFSLLTWVSSDPRLYIPPTAVAKVNNKRDGLAMVSASKSATTTGENLPPMVLTNGNNKGKAWLTKDIFRGALMQAKKLRDGWEQETGERVALVITFDAAPIHKDLGGEWEQNRLEADAIFLHVIPAGLTSLVQPCDTGSVFRSIKSHARRLKLGRELEGTPAVPLSPEWWACFRAEVRNYSTAREFARCGFLPSYAQDHQDQDQRRHLSRALQSVLRLTDPKPAANEDPQHTTNENNRRPS